MIVDAHHHLWDPGRRPYAWMTPEVEALRRPYGLEDLRAVTGPAGVTATVVVEAARTEEETVELLAIAGASDGLVAGVVGWVDLTAPDVDDRLAALREAPGGDRLVGVRHPVQDEPDAEWLLRADVRRGLRAVADARLAYDLLVLPHQLRAATKVAGDLPRVVLDHAAKPGIRDGAWEPWSTELQRLAAHEHVHAKLSGLVTEASAPAETAPYATRLLEAFGPSRTMFGSDWPVCTLAASYEEVLALARGALDGDEREDVLGRTAARFYGLSPSGRR